MFTLKWKKAGYEEVFPILRAWYRDSEKIMVGYGEQNSPRLVGFEKPDGEMATISEGDVFVMNEYGKTVADYHFGEMLMMKGISGEQPV